MNIIFFIAILLIIVNFGKAKRLLDVDNEEIEKRLTESNNDGKQNPLLRTILDHVNHLNDDIKQVKDTVSALQKSVDDLKNNQPTQPTTQPTEEMMGSTYIRFGKKKCTGSKTETVYKGQVGGGYPTHPGSGVNYLCLPNEPNVGQKLTHSDVDYLYGAEYELYSYNKPVGVKNGIGNHDVPCAVCNAKGKTRTLMIPGRKNCYKGWKREYDGYLMAGYYNHAGASEYVCLDKSTETLYGGHASNDAKLFYPVKTQCGSLRCPPYEANREVLCVVCSK